MGGQRILVVEDHESLVAGIKDILETEGYVEIAVADEGVGIRRSVPGRISWQRAWMRAWTRP